MSLARTRLLVAAAALLPFLPALRGGFAGWDDPAYVANNPLIQGLDAAHVRAMATSALGGVWIPLTWLSLAVDHALGGGRPFAFHLTNLLLHAASALLFLEVGRELFNRAGTRAPETAAALAALFFAVHPLRVESVAWIAERKGVLAGAFWLAALLARLRGRERAALAAFTLSLLAKPNGLTLPLVVLALERGLLRRRLPLASYAPWLALSIGAFAATQWAGSRPDAAAELTRPFSPAWAAGQALYGLFFYPLKTLWPADLSVYYPPRPWFATWSWPHAAYTAALAAVLSGLAAAGPKARAAAAVLACYAFALLPMLGLVAHGMAHAAADRFSYLPSLALSALLGAAFAAAGRRGVAAAALALALLSAASWSRCGDWRTPLSLWSAAARAQPGAYALANEGALLAREGRYEEALAPLRASLALSDEESVPHEALGAALQALGREGEARAAWRAGLAAAPSAVLHGRLGASLAKGLAAERAEGVALLRRAVAEQPEAAAWRAELGDALAREGKTQEARAELETAVALAPGLGAARVSLGNLLARSGRLREAAEQYRAVLKEDRASFEARHNLAAVEAALRDPR